MCIPIEETAPIWLSAGKLKFLPSLPTQENAQDTTRKGKPSDDQSWSSEERKKNNSHNKQPQSVQPLVQRLCSLAISDGGQAADISTGPDGNSQQPAESPPATEGKMGAHQR